MGGLSEGKYVDVRNEKLSTRCATFCKGLVCSKAYRHWPLGR